MFQPRAPRRDARGGFILALPLLFLPASILGLPASAAERAPDRGESLARYVVRVSDANRVWLSLTNFGFLGNNFTSRFASLEYPGGSGLEHLPNGGLWIGARSQDAGGSFVGVTTASLDISQGLPSTSATEFTPVSDLEPRSRSSLSPYHHPSARSDLDLIATFNDSVVVRASGNPEEHRPLGITVRQTSHAFASPLGLADLLVLRYVVESRGPALSGVWVGLMTQFASGDKNAYTIWPPASSGSPYGGWYRHKWVAYEDSLRLLREHYCASAPVPQSCLLERAPAWIGLVLLTPPAGGQARTLAMWNWSPSDPARDTDAERYALMSAGTLADPSAYVPGADDPVELLAIGPFGSLAPGDSIAVDFAIVGAADEEGLRERAREAHRLFRNDYDPDLPTPVAIALVSAEADPDRVRLVWRTTGSGRDVRVERRDHEAWRTLGAVVAGGDGRIAFEDASVEPGRRYFYRLALDGETTPEVEVLVPGRASLALLGAAAVGPSEVEVRYTAPGRAVAFDLLDPAGRRLGGVKASPKGGGASTVRIAAGAPLAPGIYLVRATADGRRAVRRFVVLR